MVHSYTQYQQNYISWLYPDNSPSITSTLTCCCCQLHKSASPWQLVSYNQNGYLKQPSFIKCSACCFIMKHHKRIIIHLNYKKSSVNSSMKIYCAEKHFLLTFYIFSKQIQTQTNTSLNSTFPVLISWFHIPI